MVSLENNLQIFKVNLKVAFLNNVLLTALLLLVIPIIFSVSNLDSLSAAKICEEFIVIIGVILLVPLFSPEEIAGIRETVEVKYTSQLYVYILRILISLIITVLLIALTVLMFVMFGGSFNAGKLIAGTFASAFFLGTMGLFVTAISGQVMAGYMVPIVYFVFDMMTKGKYTKDFFLFSLMNNSVREKYYLLGAGSILMVASLVVYVVKKNLR